MGTKDLGWMAGLPHGRVAIVTFVLLVVAPAVLSGHFWMAASQALIGLGLVSVLMGPMGRRLVELEDVRARGELILQNLCCGVICFEEDGKVTYVNPAAERIFGPLAGPAQPDVAAYVPCCRLAGEIRTGGPWECLALRQDGREVSVELTILGRVSRTGRVFVALVKDLTELRRAQEMKEAFISTITHELKSPLLVLTMSLEHVKNNLNGELDPKLREIMDIASQRGKWMIRLVNEVLTYEQWRAGREKCEIEELDPCQLARSVVDGYGLLARETGVHVAFDEDVTGICVRADRDQLVRVLDNLLSNAVKYSDAGSQVAVRVSAVDGKLRFSVSDHGKGFLSSDAPLASSRARRGSPAVARLMSSTGHGLSICKAILAQHQSQLQYESHEGQGTTFYFDLPGIGDC